MNFISKIIEQIIVSLNKIINGLDDQTVETIKRGFYSMVFMLVIVGSIIGYYSGKDAARSKSASISEFTDDVFQVDIKRQREGGDFRSMLETEMLGKQKDQGLKKKRFPVNEKLKIEANNTIFEPDGFSTRASPLPMPDTRDRIAEVDRIDGDGKDGKIEVKKLNRRNAANKNSADHRMIFREKDNNYKIKEKKYSAEKNKVMKNSVILEPIKKDKILIER